MGHRLLWISQRVFRSAGFIWRLTKTVWDRYAATLTPKGKVAQSFFLFLIPVSVASAFWTVCQLTGVARVPDCGPGVLPHLLVPGIWKKENECHSIPLSVDLPSIALGMTSTFAITIYMVFVHRLQRLKKTMVASGLVRAEDMTQSSVADRINELDKEVRLNYPYRMLVLLLCILAGILLYYWTWKNGRMFGDLSNGAAYGTERQSIRSSWWANYKKHPALALLWVSTGSVGVYFASKQAYVYMKLTSFARKTRVDWKFQFVPRSRDDDFGWKPVGEIISICYIGFLNFTVSVTTLAYLLRRPSGSWWNPVVALVSTVGIFLNAALIFALLYIMMKNHRAIIKKERARTAARIRILEKKSGAAQNHPEWTYLTVKGGMLFDAPRWYPLKGKAKPIISVLPAVIAISRFFVEFSN